MALFNPGIAGDISLAGDIPKIQSYLYRLNEHLRYMFNNLNPEDNYSKDAYLTYVEDGDKLSRFEVNIDNITAEMVTEGNVVSAINLSREGVKIKGDKIGLEGVVTVNSYFRVNLDGSIEATNGIFSGHLHSSSMDTTAITASTMESSVITLGGQGMDGKVIVNNASGTEIGRWDKNGIDVKTGSISGTGITLGGSGNTGKISLLNGSGVEIGTWDKYGQKMKAADGTTVIGKWDETGIDVMKGSIKGTGIELGGLTAGNPGYLKIYGNTAGRTDADLIGQWTNAGLEVRKGTIKGTGIELGGLTSGNPGSLKIYGNTAGRTDADLIGQWTNAGLEVRKGSIIGSTITIGGLNNVDGALTILDADGTTTIGSWNSSGITVNKGVIDIKRNTTQIGLYAGNNQVKMGDFIIADYAGRQIFESNDEMTGMSGEPNAYGKYYLWAGWRDDDDFAFAVENQGGNGADNVVINGNLYVNGIDVMRTIANMNVDDDQEATQSETFDGVAIEIITSTRPVVP